MLKIDEAILDANKNICENIYCFSEKNRGLLSQNILAQLRNFVEYICQKINAGDYDTNPNDYKLKAEAIKSIEGRGNLRFLFEFHSLLQKSASHYSLNEDGSERLMLKYYEYLLHIKNFLKDKYDMKVLKNIENFPLNTDTELSEYYSKIAEKIIYSSNEAAYGNYADRYYIQKIKPFFVNENIYYEVTFTTANTMNSKFDRAIAFTDKKILPNYSVRLKLHNDSISVFDRKMNIQIIDSWDVSIRPCEMNNFSDIFGSHTQITRNSSEYERLMEFLTKVRMPLSEFVESKKEYYEKIKSVVLKKSQVMNFFSVLDKCRDIILRDKPGSNVVRYLLFGMNNRIIKSQRSSYICPDLSNLYLSYSCIPFDKMPFCSSLKQHNPKLSYLFSCIPIEKREHELFARYIKRNTEVNENLFTNREDIDGFDNIGYLMKKYNQNLYWKHENRKLLDYKNHIYIKGYADDCNFIISKLQELTGSESNQYNNLINYELKQNLVNIDSQEKRGVLSTLFTVSHIALVYGAAGTGKTTLINYISQLFAEYEKFFIANTHPAVDNMKQRVLGKNSTFSTIKKFISNNNTETDCDILIIDECSTVSNADMREILKKASFKLIILVGDLYQIKSIYFGNWFGLARKFISASSIFELNSPFRTTNENLLTVWKRVRNYEPSIQEPLVKEQYSSKLDVSIFKRDEGDEIILCLNYDGLYGINNINNFLQNNNPNNSFQWGINTYKIGDPILFNETSRFAPLIHNNTKGCICDIQVEDKKIWFTIELEFAVNESEVLEYDLELIQNSIKGNSIVRFGIDKFKSTDEDDDYFSNTIVPFQVSYAISIHKAQGLEYDSVKIVLTNEVEEQITHNIFYTAITRAKENLKIYWSPETENKVISNFSSGKNSERDFYLLKQLYGIKESTT
ncbi:ATP-dependent RecD-like DNA helicase [Tetragenococcus koreensis]|uniref:ATP-dependent DNA helicase n=1 Tax=Tetragenococcus koreensis TaxID=290335 RepID=UPI001F338022|nr:ATP-dependent RecD-like DNA helicase [Tetragenococcus koreensis]MCF1613612.1 ATP-dependent RecD-like DNA helicase [Tetragenococcus koreensis]MCF1623392.1 ATP-dependent RecD-like DNA helicase [Tetragenococcus koreensis]